MMITQLCDAAHFFFQVEKEVVVQMAIKGNKDQSDGRELLV